MRLLEIRNVNITYRLPDKNIYAVQNVNLDLNEKESVGIVGESGSGKSTLAMGLLRLLPKKIAAVSGTAKLNGEDIFTMSDERLREIRWVKMSVVFQKAMNAMSPVHRIGDQMMDIYRAHFPREARDDVKSRILALFKMVNLNERVYSAYPHELSGGMMQRVAIALSLLFHPDVLLMDEATTALDVVTQSQILNEIMELEKSMKIARIMITHDVSVVAGTCRRVVVMYAGQIMEVGDVRDVLVHPRHPYTDGLLKSFPSFTGARSTLTGIPGNLPDLSHKATGCVFADRCPFAKTACHAKAPLMKNYSDTWQAACHYPLGGTADGNA